MQEERDTRARRGAARTRASAAEAEAVAPPPKDAPIGQTDLEKPKKGRGRARKSQKKPSVPKKAEEPMSDDDPDSAKSWTFEKLRAKYVETKRRCDSLLAERRADEESQLDRFDEKMEAEFENFKNQLQIQTEIVKDATVKDRAAPEKSDNRARDVNLIEELLSTMRSLKDDINKERERHDTQTTPPPHHTATPQAAAAAATNGSLGKSVEEVNLLTPEGSPQHGDSSGARVNLPSAEQPQQPTHHQSGQAAQITSLSHGSLPSPISLQNSTREMGLTPGRASVPCGGVTLCPEATIQAHSLTRATAQLQMTPMFSPEKLSDAFQTPPRGKKRSEMEPASDFDYEPSKSALKSKAQQAIFGKTSPQPMSAAEVEKKFTESQLKTLPDLDRIGFEKKFISTTEVLYEHTRLQDKFALLCSNFGEKSKAPIEYVPIVISGLLDTLPNHLKNGRIEFKKDMMGPFVQLFSKAVVAPLDSSSKKVATIQKTV